MKKNDELKQSKVSRHEMAKQKFRFFQRSISCKSLNTKGDYIPTPGQFAILANTQKLKNQQKGELPNIHNSQKKIQNNEKQLKFTTNLKLITRQRSPSRVSELLNDTVNRKIDQRKSLKKIIKSQSSGNVRPITAISTQLMNDLQGKNNLNQSKMIVNAAQYDKKYYLKKQFGQGNTFMVKNKSGIPKHAYGHKSIRLSQPDQAQKRQLKLQTPSSKFTKISTSQQQDEQQNINEHPPAFLPIEYYMIDDKKPQQLIFKYKITENVLVGYSKWYDVEGKFEWKKCRIIQYMQDKERWQIQWLHNGKRKLVARNNLYFQKQKFEDYQKIIQQAEKFRTKSEIYMKYNWLIDNMKTQTHLLEENQLARILKLAINKLISDKSINQNKHRSIELLMNEIKQKYIRANHIVQFNSSLPFNSKYKQQFRGYLPQTFFVPNTSINKFALKKFFPQNNEARKILRSQQSLQKIQSHKVLPSFELKKFFQVNIKRFQQSTSLSSKHRIQIIEFLNKTQYQIKNKQISNIYDIQSTLSQEQNYFMNSSKLKFFSLFPNKIYNLSDIVTRMDNALFESISKINNVVCEIQYFVAKQLDPLYLERKAYGYEDFQCTIANYRKFLALANMRMQNIGRDLLFGIISQFANLINLNNSILMTKSSSQFYQKLVDYKQIPSTLKLKIKFQIKGENIECFPKKSQISSIFNNFIGKLIQQFSNISCIRKSYIEQLRPKNKMKINESLEQTVDAQTGKEIYQWKPHSQLLKIKEKISQAISNCQQVYQRFYLEGKKILQNIINLQNDIKKKTSKKCNFSDIEEYLQSIKVGYQNINKLKFMSVNVKLNFKNNCDDKQLQKRESNQLFMKDQKNLLKQTTKNELSSTANKEPKFVRIGIFYFSIEQFILKSEAKLYQFSIQVYKLILQKILKQTEKLQKSLASITQKLQTQPLNIKEMISLEQYIQEQASQELHKITSKIKQLHEKFELLEKLNQYNEGSVDGSILEIDYKDFYQCHRVYIKPMMVRAKMIERLRKIQIQYKKVFGEGLMRDASELLNQSKEVQEKFYSSIQINSIQEMDSSFLVFSKLKQRIQTALSKSNQVNQYQTAMKWINTNFQRLFQIKQQFLPYYQLISLQKNYRFHIEVQLTQCLHSIDANRISQEVITGCDQLANLEANVFYNNSTILSIVKQVGESYKRFRDKLPLLQILRNSDLRQRHWVSIKQLTGFSDILSDKITYQELEQRDIKKFEKRLIQISHIATRELIYEKRLNKMKKEWKQLKIQLTSISTGFSQSNQQQSENSSNQLKNISNLAQIQTKTENDIYQIQEILSSSFIKFLEKDILAWRNYTLYKMYQFIEIWEKLQKQIIQMHGMFSRGSMKNQANAEYLKFKALQKNWRNIITQIQQQPNVLQLLQTKVNDSLKYTVELIQDLKKSVNQFFEKKKQRFSRFGSLSQEELIALFSNNDEKQCFDQAVRKCLHGVKNVIRNEVRNITRVKTHLDQQIIFKEVLQSPRNQSLSPDKIIQDIEKRIKRSLRNSIEDINQQKSNKILQIILFHQRIIFTRQIQNQLTQIDQDCKGIKEGYINALLGLKAKIIEALFSEYQKTYDQNMKRKKQQNLIKIQSQLNQLINHIEIAQFLYNKNVQNICDFEWLTQIRTYQKNSSYTIQIGLNHFEYGFQITDQQNFIVQEITSKIFFYISMAAKQRMFSILNGNIGSGKLAIFHYLANIHGKNQYVLNCHKALSYENVFDFFRMAANGIWIVFNSINLLSTQVFSCFRQSSQLFWSNYPTVKSKTYFTLGDKNITFSTHEIGLFSTINLNKNNHSECQKISDKLSTYFRNFNILPLDIRYILECKLILDGFQYCSNTKKFIKMIQTIQQECQKYYQTKESQGFQVYKSITFSKLNFIQKVVDFAKRYKQQYKDKQIDDYLLLELGLFKGIQQVTKNLGFLKFEILQKLKKYFNFIVKFPAHRNQETQNFDLRGTIGGTQKGGEQNINQHDQLIKRDIKKFFLDKKLFSNRQIINHYFEILNILKQKHSIIILGSCSTGKSTFIDLLSENKINKEDKLLQGKYDKINYIDNFKIDLCHVHPNAYSLKQLYGDSDKNGIINCLIKYGYEQLEKQKSNQAKIHIQKFSSSEQTFRNIGLVFDSEIGDWIEPLLPLIKNSSNYIQPNGKNVIIENPIKFIFQCRDLSSVSPSIILSTNIVQLQDYQLKWQSIFSQYLKKNFSSNYQKKAFLDFSELLVTFIMEPVFEFFKSSINNNNSTSKSTNPTFLTSGSSQNQTSSYRQSSFVSSIYQSFAKNQINYIPLIFNLFIALVQSYFLQSQKEAKKSPTTINEKRKGQQFSGDPFSKNSFDDKEKSAILNIFIMSITWTIGLFIPEQSKKTFSRHFKYLIKRAVQLNIKGIQKDSLPKDDQDIFDICFLESKWHQWEQVPKIIKFDQSSFEYQDNLILKHKIKYLFLLQRYCKANLPFFILGKSSTGKNALALEFLSSLSGQTHNKILIPCTSNSSHLTLKYELKKQIERQKYSHTFKGFVHGKYTMIYLCDANLPLIKNDLSLDQFLHEYIKQNGWYLSYESKQFYEFKNISFCGTMNSSVKYSEHLLKYMNPILYTEDQNGTKDQLFSIFSSNQYLCSYKESVIKLMMNLKQVISRQFKHKFKISTFTLKDLCDIAQKINFKLSSFLLKSNSSSKEIISSLKFDDSNGQKSKKIKILQCWINQTQRKYLQKFGSNYDRQKLFYFINNVLMQEERLRYKNIIPSQNLFIANLPYYLSKFKVQNKENLDKRKTVKLTKTFLTPNSYRIYESLEEVQRDVSNLQSLFDKVKASSQDINEQYDSLSSEIRNNLIHKKDSNNITIYVQYMTALLDYILEDQNYLIFLINDVSNTNPLSQSKSSQNQNSIKQLFEMNQATLKKRNENDDAKNISKLSQSDAKMNKLLNYVCKINNSKILQYSSNYQQQSDLRLDWKIFINEIFQLINSPASAGLHQHYIIHLKGLRPEENFILQDLLKLKRTGQLSMLEQFINSEELQIDEALQRQNSKNKSQQTQRQSLNDQIDGQRSEQMIQQLSQHRISQNQARKLMAQKKKQLNLIIKKNTAQIIREKILRKIKFVVSINESYSSKIQDSYSILFEKCHILWASQLYTTSQPIVFFENISNSVQKIQQSNKDSKNVRSSNKSIQSQQSKLIIQENENQIKNNFKNVIKIKYLHHKQSFNHFLLFKEVKQIYIMMFNQEWTKEKSKVIETQINQQENLEFLSFLKLIRNIKEGIEKKINQKILTLQQQCNYFENLSLIFLKDLSEMIKLKKILLQSNQNHLKMLSTSIQKLSQENEKFLAYFIKSEQSIQYLEKQSREANQVYNNFISQELKGFSDSQAGLIELLKTAKDKKIVLTNQMKLYLQVFGIVINKKLKPEQNMVKEIIKDISILKVHKKVSNLFVEYTLNQIKNQKVVLVSQKAIAKLKQLVSKNLQVQLNSKMQQFLHKQKQQKQIVKPVVNKELSLSQSLLILLKQYFVSLLIYFNKCQQEPIKILNKKCSKCIKQLANTKQQYQKSQKNKQFQKVTSDLSMYKDKRIMMLRNFDQQKKQFEFLVKLQKQCTQIACINMSGQIDQKQIIAKQSKALLNNNQGNEQIYKSNENNPNLNIVIQKIISDYGREKNNFVALNNCKDIIAFLISLKILSFQTSKTNNFSIDMNIFYKVLSRQALQAMRSVKLDLWQNLFQNDLSIINQNQLDCLDKFDVFDYFIKQFDYLKVLTFAHGLVCLNKTTQIQNWIQIQQNKTVLKYDNSLFQKLIDTITQYEQIISSSKIHLIEPYYIFIEIHSNLELQLFQTDLQRQNSQKIKDYLTKNVIILLSDNQTIQRLKNSKIDEKTIINQTKIQIFEYNGPKTKYLAQMETKFQDQLCQQKKQSDSKVLIKYKELKQSQKQNIVERRKIIRNSPVKTFKALFSQEQKLPFDQRYQNMINIEENLANIKQNFLQYSQIASCIQSLPNIISLKRRSNIHATKSIKYITRAYQGLQVLQEQNVIFATNSIQRYSNFVLWIIQRQKQLMKNQSSQNKLFRNIKNKIFQYYLIVNDNQKLFIGLVFALAGQQSLAQKQYEKLLKLIIRIYRYSRKIMQIDLRIKNQFNNQQTCKKILGEQRKNYVIDNFILKKTNKQTKGQAKQLFSLTKNQNFKQQAFCISQNFQQILDLFSDNFSCFKDIKIHFKKKTNAWIDFFINIESKFGQNIVNTLPEPYNDINRSFFGLFVALVNTSLLESWINIHLIQEDLTKLSEVQNLSNQQKIFKLIKFNYKQTVLIGENSISKLYDLSVKFKKSVKIYSKFEIQKRKAYSSNQQTSFKNSPHLTKKQIPISQLSFFNNRKFSQQFVQELYQCMKNSSWLVIDLENLNNFVNDEQCQTITNINKIESIIKLIDLYTNDSRQDKLDEQGSSNQTTHHAISETSQKSFSGLPNKLAKNQFNFNANFDNCQYQIFFLFPNYLKQQIFKINGFVNNHQRAFLQLRLQNQTERCLNINKFYHEELMITKKITKQYQSSEFKIKQIIYYSLNILQESLTQLFLLECNNKQFFQNLPPKSLLKFKKIMEILDKISKILLILLAQPQLLSQLIELRQKPKILTQQLSQQSQYKQIQEQKQVIKRQKHQPKINSRFHKDKLVKKDSIPKNSALRTSRASRSKILQALEHDQQVESSQKIQIEKKQKQQKRQKSKYQKIVGIIKLIHSYVQSSLDQKDKVVFGITKIFDYYTDYYFLNLENKKINGFENQIPKQNRIEEILISDVNKTYSSPSKIVIEDLLTFLKEQQMHESDLNSKKSQIAFYKNNLDCFQNLRINNQNLKEVKLFLERLMKFYPELLRSQNFNLKIHQLNQIKKTCQNQLTQFKRQFLKEEFKSNQAQNSSNQFNFSSLTQNLTIEEMRKKLSLNKKSISNQNLNQPNESKGPSSLQKMKEYIFKRKQRFIELIDNKISSLKAFKSIFLLQKINYEVLQLVCKKASDMEISQFIKIVFSLNQKNQDLNLFKHQNQGIKYLKNSESFNFSNFTFKQSKKAPLFNLQTFEIKNQLSQFVKILKQTFGQINKLKPSNIKHHFIIQQSNEQTKILKNNRKGITFYKICSFEGFSFYNCKRVDNILYKNKVVFTISNQIGFIKYCECVKISLYFEQKDQQSDFESDQESDQQNQQYNSILNKKVIKIPFYLRKIKSFKTLDFPSSQQFDNINIQIEVQRNTDVTANKNVNSFIYY